MVTIRCGIELASLFNLLRPTHSGGSFVGNIWNIPGYPIRNESGQSRANDKDEHKTSDLLRHNKPDIDIGGCCNNGDRVCPARAGGKIGRQRIDIENFDESEGQAATKCD